MSLHIGRSVSVVPALSFQPCDSQRAVFSQRYLSPGSPQGYPDTESETGRPVRIRATLASGSERDAASPELEATVEDQSLAYP